MKQFKNKKTLFGFIGLGLGIVLLSSCTANFCSPVDQAAMAYPYDQGATVYVSKEQYEKLRDDDATKVIIQLEETWSAEAVAKGLPAIAGPAFGDAAINDKVYKYIPYNVAAGFGDSLALTANKTKGFLADFMKNAKTAGYSLPGLFYYAFVDDYVLKASTYEQFSGATYYAPAVGETDPWNDTFLAKYKTEIAAVYSGSDATELPADYVAVNPYLGDADPAATTTQIPQGKSILRGHGHVKFTGKDGVFFANYVAWNKLIRAKAAEADYSHFTIYDLPGIDYDAYYKAQITSKVSTYRSCIATKEGDYGHYGTYADWRVSITQKDWGYAWSKGFLEGLLVYPVTWVLDNLAFSFDANLSGMGQIWALVIVTLIVRGILLAVSFRSTLDGQKMQALQPELARLQQKYPNAQTNPAEKQRMSQEQMMLYRRHGIKPFRQIIVMIVQFPVFICVWAGLQGSAALSTGEILGMRLSDNINSILFNVTGWWMNDHGWWTALVLFLLMAGTQVFAMALPRIIAKKRAQGVARTVKAQQNNTMKWVSYGLIIFTIVMGFFLPSAMGVYWLIGGLISIVQTLITQAVMARSKKGI